MICILTEKFSAAQNFAKAFGGMEGIYKGSKYKIVHSVGHLFKYPDPQDMLKNRALAKRYETWSLEYLPWDENDFTWKRQLCADKKDVFDEIASAVDECDEVIIATDDDPSGEGDLIGWEILDAIGVDDKEVTRMRFVDESPASILKAFDRRDGVVSMRSSKHYQKAEFRTRWDYMSMQLTRGATICGGGVIRLREGRLKTYMVRKVGDQYKLIDEYKEIPFYENRFRDDHGIVYINKDAERYEKPEQVPQNLHASEVVLDKTERKHSSPPKLLDLSALSAFCEEKGFKASLVLDTYQKMYNDQIVSYPRTEDKTITHEQFNELLPLANKIAAVVGVDPAILTHRAPRPTHVKNTGSHGANRPGPVVPASKEELKGKYEHGAVAALIYEIVARNFLALLAEDYEYDKQTGHIKDFPEYIGSCNIPVKPGFKAIFSLKDDKDKDTENKEGLGTKAEPFVHEGFPPKPQVPTWKWLQKDLEKNDIGTGATRTSTYADVTNDESKKGKKFPLLKSEKGKITMTDYGKMSYVICQNTHISELDLTKKVQNQMQAVFEGNGDAKAFIHDIQTLVKEDIATMAENGRSDAFKAVCVAGPEFVEGNWNGAPVKFRRTYDGYRFTDEECDMLLRGGEITIKVVKSKHESYMCKGKLERQTWTDKKTGETKEGVGFTRLAYVDDPTVYCRGVWNGENVRFRRDMKGHYFTDEECEQLLNGETITIEVKKSKTDSYTCEGKLAHLTYEKDGKTIEYVGFSKTSIPIDTDKYCVGMWNGEEIKFKRVWKDYSFSEEECRKLLAGEKITISGQYKGKDFTATGELRRQVFEKKEGKKVTQIPFIGFYDLNGPTDDDYYHGTWKGKPMKFKKKWSTYEFSPEEAEKLFAGESITITAMKKDGSGTYTAEGSLQNYTYNGRKQFGFQLNKRS